MICNFYLNVAARKIVFADPYAGLVSCLQHASKSQERICSDNRTCCHTEAKVADQTFHLTQSQYTDTGPTSSTADLITPGAWPGSHWSAVFEVTNMGRRGKILMAQAEIEPLSRRTPYPLGQRGGFEIQPP